MTPAEQKLANETMLKVASEVFEGLKGKLLAKFPDADLSFSGQAYAGRIVLHVICKAESLPLLIAECSSIEETVSYPEIRIVVKEGC